MKALIIKQPFLDQILDGIKIIEMRNMRTHFRGRIKLIASKTKLIYGEVDIIDCIEIQHKQYRYGWILKNPIRYSFPKASNQKFGVQVFCNI